MMRGSFGQQGANSKHVLNLEIAVSLSEATRRHKHRVDHGSTLIGQRVFSPRCCQGDRDVLGGSMRRDIEVGTHKGVERTAHDKSGNA